MTNIPYLSKPSDTRLSESISSGSYCCVYGWPESGKTQSLNVAKEEFSKKTGYECAYVSLDSLASSYDAFHWYVKLSKHIGNSLSIEDTEQFKLFFDTDTRGSFLSRYRLPRDILYNFIESVVLKELPSEKIILFIDDLDKAEDFRLKEEERNLEGFEQDFFKVIHGCYQESLREQGELENFRRIQFVLAGAIPLPTLKKLSNEYFGNEFLKLIPLEDFSFEQIRICF